MRGAFLRHVTEKAKVSKEELFAPYLLKDLARAENALAGLVADGFVTIDPKGYVKIKK